MTHMMYPFRNLLTCAKTFGIASHSAFWYFLPAPTGIIYSDKTRLTPSTTHASPKESLGYCDWTMPILEQNFAYGDSIIRTLYINL